LRESGSSFKNDLEMQAQLLQQQQRSAWNQTRGVCFVSWNKLDTKGREPFSFCRYLINRHHPISSDLDGPSLCFGASGPFAHGEPSSICNQAASLHAHATGNRHGHGCGARRRRWGVRRPKCRACRRAGGGSCTIHSNIIIPSAFLLLSAPLAAPPWSRGPAPCA